MNKPLLLLLLTATAAAPRAVPAHDVDADAIFLESLSSNLEAVSRKIVALAEAIPADQYSWSPTPEVRSVSELFMHVVGGNFQLPVDLGAPAPAGIEIGDQSVWFYKQQRRQWESDFVEKEEVVDLLARSFEYAISAIPSITDLDETASTWGFPESKRDYLLLLMSHAHEHLGQSITYTRELGITPPWSQTAETEQAPSTAVFEDGIARGTIVSIDRFGNLETSFVAKDLETLALEVGTQVALEACDSSAQALLGEHLFDVRPGQWIALISPQGTLTVGKSFGSAAEEFNCPVGSNAVLRRIER